MEEKNTTKSTEGTTNRESPILSLVRRLARDTQVRVAFVCELTENRPDTARTVALSVDGQFLDNMEYKVAGTPCERVYQEGELVHPSDISRIYPEDRMLAEWKIDSYMGVAIFGPEGKPIGHLGVMHDRALPDQAHTQSVLRDLAPKVGNELERRTSDS